MDLNGNYWVPWALAGVMIIVMVIYALKKRNWRNKRK